MNRSITTITFIRYSGVLAGIIGFLLIPVAYLCLLKSSTRSFSKVMGSGSEKGFHPYPDWSVYSVLVVWSNEEEATKYLQRSLLFRLFRLFSKDCWTVFMKTIQSKGKWSGAEPFLPSEDIEEQNTLVAVVTRAAIRWNKLRLFWKQVPFSETPLHTNKGLLFTKGIGEFPLLQMATFSIWKDTDSLRAYAYQSPQHREAIQKTKTLQWYSEELFSRFQPYASTGKWGGLNPLKDLLSATTSMNVVS